MADNIIVEIQLEASKNRTAFNSIEKQAEVSGTKAAIKFSDNFSKSIKASMTRIKDSVGGVIAGFLAFNAVKNTLIESSRAAIDFEKSVREINTILPNNTKLTNEQVQALRGLARQYGTSATSQAKAFYQTISAGVTDTAKATKLLSTANKLSIGGLTSVENSIDVLTTIINSYGQENINATQAADALFTAVRLGKTNMDELAASIGLAVPSAKSAGVNIDVLSAAVATLTTKGFTTNVAVTRLNALFTALAKNGALLGKGFDLNAVKSDGLVTVLKRLGERTNNSSEALLKLLGRQEAVQAVQTLAANGARDFAQALDGFSNKAGAADDAFKEFKTSLAFRKDKIISDIGDIAITLGNVFAPAALGAAESVVRLIKGLTRKEEPTILSESSKRINELRDNITDLTEKKNILQGEKEGKGVGLFRSLFGDIDSELQEVNRDIELAESEIATLMAQRREARAQEESEKRNAEHQADLERTNRELSEKAALEEQKLREAQQRKAELLKEYQKKQEQQLARANAIVNASLSGGITRGIQNTIIALRKGDNALQAFGNSIVSLFGDLATQLGQFYVAEGIAKLALLNANPAAQITAGASLIAIGQIIKSSLGGGDTSSNIGGGGGGGATGGVNSGIGVQPELASPENIARAEEQSVFNLTVEGSLVRESELDGYVANLLEEGGKKKGTIIPSVRTA